MIPDAWLYYRIDREGDGDRAMLRAAFVEVDRATMGPERLVSKIHAYQRLFEYVPVSVGWPRVVRETPGEAWQRRYR